MGASLFSSAAFRFRNDDGNETTATWKALQNVNVNLAVNTNFRIRFRAQETGGAAGNNKTWQLQYNKNGAGWVNVSGSSLIARAFPSPNVTDAANVTSQLAGGTGTFQGATGFDEANGQAGGSSMDVAASGHAETEFCLQLRSVDLANADSVGLRISDAGVALNAYAVNATATVVMGTSGQLSSTLAGFTLDSLGQLTAVDVDATLTKTLDAITLASTMFAYRIADLAANVGAITLTSTAALPITATVGTANIETRYFAEGYFTDTYWWDGEWTISVAGEGLTLLPIILDAAMGPAPGIGSLIHIPQPSGNLFYYKDTYFADGYFYHYYWKHLINVSNDFFTLSATATLSLNGTFSKTLDVFTGFDLGMGEQPFGYLPLGYSQAVGEGRLLISGTFIKMLDIITLIAMTAATLAGSASFDGTLGQIILVAEGESPAAGTFTQELLPLTLSATGQTGVAPILPASLNGYVPIFETNDTANNLVPVHFVDTLDYNVVPVRTMEALDNNVVPVIIQPAGPNVVDICEVQ